MKWMIRWACLFLMMASAVACSGFDDVGKPCNLTQQANRDSLKDLGDKARIVEASAQCDILSFCFANFYDDTKNENELGYCSKECNSVQDCPNETEYECNTFIKISQAPSSHPFLGALVGTKICIKLPPQTP